MSKSSVFRNTFCITFWSKSHKMASLAPPQPWPKAIEKTYLLLWFWTPQPWILEAVKKYYVLHYFWTWAHFGTFGRKSDAFRITFYTTFRHGHFWSLLVRKVMRFALRFSFQVDMGEKVFFPFLSLSTWKENCNAKRITFRTKSDQKRPCRKVV